MVGTPDMEELVVVEVSGCRPLALVLGFPSLLGLPLSRSRYLSRGRLRGKRPPHGFSILGWTSSKCVICPDMRIKSITNLVFELG